MLAYLAMFGYIHQENETPLSTAITGKQVLMFFCLYLHGSYVITKIPTVFEMSA